MAKTTNNQILRLFLSTKLALTKQIGLTEGFGCWETMACVAGQVSPRPRSGSRDIISMRCRLICGPIFQKT
ncbi:hypothetical protein M404DRAFT_1004081 [Pisolithus tinctorius Marx 270]|uniref:Uncharacterized protein n=1 Tax=Pisolithus tinctorius Marx 270 TaxID=870435 RepID=A0A0C3JRP2_PISTI|nr:hypothetical protein M404DRAFT_1004081 [Pisolithus tinctorius Marx 270]